MPSRARPGVLALTLLLACPAAARPAPPPAEDPVLRLEPGGPTSLVTALAFGPDGSTLYEAGWDKVIRVWRRDAGGRFRLGATLRVPIGPAESGQIYALALSADGNWLAAGGHALYPGAAGFRESGVVVPRLALTPEMRRASGVIHVFDLRADPPVCRPLQGHQGRIEALRFVDSPPGAPPLLVSAGPEPDGQRKGALTLRLWDASTGEHRGAAYGPEITGKRPWVAAWRAGDRVRAAVANGDAHGVAVWDVGKGQGPLRVFAPGELNTTLIHHPDDGLILTGSCFPGKDRVPPECHLRSWDATAPDVPVLLASAAVTWPGWLPVPSRHICVPESLATLASRPGGPRDLIGALTRVEALDETPTKQARYGLQILDLRPPRFGAALSRISLGMQPRHEPYVAAAPDGRTLALAGNGAQEVWIYSVDDLLRLGDKALPQVLRGAGRTNQGVAFVRRGDDRGLLLSLSPLGEPPAPGADAVVYVVRNRTVVPYPSGWSLARPDLRAWEVQPKERAGKPGEPRAWDLPVYGNGQYVGRVVLDPETPIRAGTWVVPTAHALLPPTAPGSPPILAVAHNQPGVGPKLGLYNVRTGELIRQLSGHAAPVRGLAFSDDGRMLISAADDRTICVWSLTNLGETLGRRGGLPGLALKDGQGSPAVAAVGPELVSRVGEALRPGDFLTGLLFERGDWQRPASALAFYRALSAAPPGDAVRVKRWRRGTEQDVPLTLGQAADERKPLLTLFLTRERQEGPWTWLAWDPAGPFDSSGPDAERLFGWHFNTGRPGQPARFALAAQYPNFRTEGLVGKLLELGDRPPPAPSPQQPPELSLSLDPVPDGPALRRPPVALKIAVRGGKADAARVKSIRWTFDGRDPVELPGNPAGFWTVDLTGRPWTRGKHSLAAVPLGEGPAATPEEASLSVRYVPAAPDLLVFRDDDTPVPTETEIVTKEASIKLRLKVQTAPGLKAGLKVVKPKSETEVFEHLNDGDERPVDLKLEAGENKFQLEAFNEDEKADKGLETSTRPLLIYHAPPRGRPPGLSLKRITDLSDKRSVAVRDQHDLGAVDFPQVRLEGRVQAEAPLTRVELVAGSTDDSRPLTGAEAGKKFDPKSRSSSFVFAETVKLSPGPQKLDFVLQAVGTPVRHWYATIEYRPPTPEIGPVLFSPTVYFPKPPRAELKATFEGTRETHPVDETLSEIRVDGEPVKPDDQHGVRIDWNRQTLTARAPLRARKNLVAFYLRNTWASEYLSVPYEVRYLHPPQVDPAGVALAADGPFADVSTVVRSPTPLRGPARVEVVDRNGAVRHWRAVTPEDAGPGLWAVRATRVPLEPGTNGVRVRAANEDGEDPELSRSSGRLVTYLGPAGPRPEVVWLEPEGTANLTRTPVEIRFGVRSASPLTRVELLRVSSTALETLRVVDQPASAAADGDGFVYVGGAAVDLDLEPIDVKVLAVNAGGESEARLTLTYVRPPVRVAVTSVEEPGGPRHALPQEGVAAGVPSRRLRGGRATVVGRIVGDQAAAPQDPAKLSAQVWVNGFPQVAVTPVRADRPHEWEFRADVLLDRPGNSVKVSLPETPAADDSRAALTLLSDRPETDRELHLLVVGEDDPRELTDRAVLALGGERLPGTDDRFTTPAFPRGRVYRTAPGRVTRRALDQQLGELRNSISLGDRPSDDLVVVYVQGRETVEGGVSTLRLASGARAADGDFLPVHEIVGWLTGYRGAKLFLFDVTRDPDALPAEPDLPRTATDAAVGIVRLVWRGRADTRPADARLTDAIRSALRTRATVKQLDDKVARWSLDLKQKYPDLEYRAFLSPAFDQLVIGVPKPPGR